MGTFPSACMINLFCYEWHHVRLMPSHLGYKHHIWKRPCFRSLGPTLGSCSCHKTIWRTPLSWAGVGFPMSTLLTLGGGLSLMRGMLSLRLSWPLCSWHIGKGPHLSWHLICLEIEGCVSISEILSSVFERLPYVGPWSTLCLTIEVFDIWIAHHGVGLCTAGFEPCICERPQFYLSNPLLWRAVITNSSDRCFPHGLGCGFTWPSHRPSFVTLHNQGYTFQPWVPLLEVH